MNHEILFHSKFQPAHIFQHVKLIHTRGYSIKSLLLRRRFGLQTGSLFSVYDTQGPTRLQRALNSLRSVASQIHVAFGRWKMSIKHFRCADRSWQKEGTPSRQEFTPHLLGPATHPRVKEIYATSSLQHTQKLWPFFKTLQQETGCGNRASF